MPRNDWPDYGTNPGSAIMSQTDWNALPDLVSGQPTGIYPQTKLTKTNRLSLKAGSVIAAVVNAAGLDAIDADDGTHTALTANFLTAMSGRFTGFQLFLTPGTFTYTPTAGTKKILIRMVGGGGGGGGCSATSAGQYATGAAGGAGAYAEHFINSLASTYTVVIGAGGAGGATSGAGTTGGNTIFGGIVTCNGGVAGPGGGAVAFPAMALAASLGGTASGANIVNAAGGQGKVGIGLQAGQCSSSGGGDSYYGGGGPITFGASGAGQPGRAGGSGGSAGFSSNGAAAQIGGAGAGGSIIIFEFA